MTARADHHLHLHDDHRPRHRPDAFIVGTALTHAFSEPSWVARCGSSAPRRGGRLQPAGADRRRPPGRRHLLVLAATLSSGCGPGEEPPPAALPLSPLHGHSPASFIERRPRVFLFTPRGHHQRRRGPPPATSTAACSSPLVRCSSSPPWCPFDEPRARPPAAEVGVPPAPARRPPSARPTLAHGRGDAMTPLNTFNGCFITASRFVYGTAREAAARQLRHSTTEPSPGAGGRLAASRSGVALWCAHTLLAGAGRRRLPSRAMIYAVPHCAPEAPTTRPRAPAPFRVRGIAVLGVPGRHLSVLALVASLSVDGSFNPPRSSSCACARPSRQLRLLSCEGPAAEARRRAATGRRRPQRSCRSGTGDVPPAGADVLRAWRGTIFGSVTGTATPACSPPRWARSHKDSTPPSPGRRRDARCGRLDLPGFGATPLPRGVVQRSTRRSSPGSSTDGRTGRLLATRSAEKWPGARRAAPEAVRPSADRCPTVATKAPVQPARPSPSRAGTPPRW